MSKGITKNHKSLVLRLLQSHAGNADGVDTEVFYANIKTITGLDSKTVEQIIKEQTGQVWKDNGRIYVIKDAFLVSETNHSRRKPRDNRNGEGIDNGLKTQWEWPRRRFKKES